MFRDEFTAISYLILHEWNKAGKCSTVTTTGDDGTKYMAALFYLPVFKQARRLLPIARASIVLSKIGGRRPLCLALVTSVAPVFDRSHTSMFKDHTYSSIWQKDRAHTAHFARYFYGRGSFLE